MVRWSWEIARVFCLYLSADSGLAELLSAAQIKN